MQMPTGGEGETHSERVEREVKQLLVDIKRIEPEADPYCNFGDLFVDESVEQYYEALVGKSVMCVLLWFGVD